MGFIKLSILAFYGSIFPLRRFRYALWAVAIFTGAWILTATFAGIFQCVPVEYGWDRTIEGGYCIKYGRVVLVVSVTNIVTDFIILLMPINPVRGLQMSPQKKKLVLLTFALGSRYAHHVARAVDCAFKPNLFLWGPAPVLSASSAFLTHSELPQTTEAVSLNYNPPPRSEKVLTQGNR